MAKTDFKTIDEYISTFPQEVQTILHKIRQTVQQVVPEAEEKISYRMPTFNLNGSYLIYFAAWKHHISLYPVPSNTKDFQDELAVYLSGKGTVKFPLKKPVPYDLVRKIVEHRLREHQEKEK